MLVAAGGWAGYRRLSTDDCPETVGLHVAAAPEIAPAVRTAAETWVRNGVCATVTVSAVDPTAMAAAVGQKHGVNLVTGLTKKQDTTADVWIPDSATWLLRLASEAPGFVPSALGSVAESPVVLAAPASSALTTEGLARRVATDKNLRPAVADPDRDAAGLGGLIVLAGAAGRDARLRVGTMRALAENRSSIRADVLQKFQSGDPIGMAPLSETDVIAYNRSGPATPLTAVYPAATVVLDYPYAIMPGIDPRKAGAATTLRTALSTGLFTAELAKAGIRSPGGTTGPGFAAPPGAPPALPPPATLDTKAITQLLGSWTAITQPGRMLAVFDVSGSMKAKVPTAGGLTRAQVTQGVARQGLALLDDRWSVGNWTFSTNLAGRRPWVENLPISPCSTHRPQMEAAISKIVPVPGGDTGLFDTALAAYQRVQQGWRAGVSNSVVIYTDGRNDNPGGLTIDDLVARMAELRDPQRPIRVIIIGMGTATDRAELEKIVEAAGSGGVFIATDPVKIGEIFLEAIASRKGA
ncbi:hypothetical protein Aab01nite_34420 [Paractinoplanes abujensis]|nr:hypothetical protein Aab01nite_34420 [Actinoplanes abujensis]